MSHRDQLIISELARALGVDVRLPQETVFEEQLRPEVRFLHINTAQSLVNQPAAQRVTVPPGERWIFDWLAIRGLADVGDPGGGNVATITVSSYEGFIVGKDELPKRAAVDVSIRTPIAVQNLTTQPNAALEFQGFKIFIGYGASTGVNQTGELFSSPPQMFYANQQIFIEGDANGAWKLADQLETRGRYRVFPEHLLNLVEAPRDDGTKPEKANPGTWNIDKDGVF